MQVSVELSEGLKRRIKVEVPADRVDNEIQSHGRRSSQEQQDAHGNVTQVPSSRTH